MKAEYSGEEEFLSREEFLSHIDNLAALPDESDPAWDELKRALEAFRRRGTDPDKIKVIEYPWCLTGKWRLTVGKEVFQMTTTVMAPEDNARSAWAALKRQLTLYTFVEYMAEMRGECPPPPR